jgi:hypothetical protein
VPMPFCRSDRILTPTWTVTSGTPLEDYEAARLTDQDPSYPLKVAEPSVTLRADLGAAARVDGLAVIHHNLAAGTSIRFRLGATAGGADVTVTVTVPAWLGRFAPHLYFDTATAAPVVGDRTRRHLELATVGPSDAPVAIGELVVAGQIDSFSGILVDAKPRLAFGRTLVEGKKGPQYVHDRRTRDRAWVGGAVLENAADVAAFTGFQQASYGVRPFLVWPLNAIEDEPIYARFIEPGYEFTLPVDLTIAHVPFAVRELACGEAY